MFRIRPNTVRHAIVVMASLLCLSCAPTQHKPWNDVGSFPNFRMQVLYDESGQPVEGVEVCAYGLFATQSCAPAWFYPYCGPVYLRKLHSTTTGADGIARLDLSEPQNYRIAVHYPPGYRGDFSPDFSSDLNEGYVNGELVTLRVQPFAKPYLDGYGNPRSLNFCDD